MLKRPVLRAVDRMTQGLVDRDRERNLMIKDYLNKTFDDIKMIKNSTFVTERRSSGEQGSKIKIRNR